MRLFHTEKQAFLTVDRLPNAKCDTLGQQWVAFCRLTARPDAAEATSSHALFEVQVANGLVTVLPFAIYRKVHYRPNRYYHHIVVCRHAGMSVDIALSIWRRASI